MAALGATVGGTFGLVNPDDPATWAVPDTSVTSVTAVVGPTTDLFSVDLQFTIQGLDCAAARATGDEPVLMFLDQTTGIDGLTGNPLTQHIDPDDPTSALVEMGSRGGDAGQTLRPCDDGVVNPDGTMTVTTDHQHALQMFTPPGKPQRNLPMYPNEEIDVRAAVVWEGGQLPGTDQVWHPVVMPTVPLWLGVGDGYTSAVRQASAQCPWYQSTTNAAISGSSCVGFNTKPASWIQSAVDGVNAKLGVAADWRVVPDVIATETTTAAALASDSNPQILAMHTKLADHGAHDAQRIPADGTDPVTYHQPGSWNWIGVSAGLRDSGIIDSLLSDTLPTELKVTAAQSTTAFSTDPRNVRGWYRSHALTAEGQTPTAGAMNPWSPAVATGTAYKQQDCPRIENVPSLLVSNPATGTLTARGQAIRDGVENVYSEAKAVAASTGSTVNIVELQYPYFSELAAQTVGGYTTPCQAIVKSAVDALDTAASLSAHADVVQVDLRTTLGTYPTGTVTAANNPATRTEDAIQLRKPYGFPYLSDGGSGNVGQAVVNALYPRRPEVVYSYDHDPVGAGAYGPDAWFNSTVTVHWMGSDPDSNRTWSFPDTVIAKGAAGAEGKVTLDAPIACKTATLCSDPYQVDVFTDFTAPQAHVAVTDPTSHQPVDGVVIGGTTWYGQKVNLDWVVDADVNPTDPNGAVSDVDPTVAVPPTVTVNEGANQTFWNGLSPQPAQATTLCDQALNCRLLPATVSVDLTAPTLSLAPSASVLVHENADGSSNVLYNPTLVPDLKLTWTASDGAGSGVVAQPDVITVDNATGTKTYTRPPVCDRVGHCTDVPPVTVEASLTAAAVPTITGQAGGSTVNGWYHADVPVTWTVNALPGAALDAPSLITAEGASSSVTGTVTDAGGTATDVVTVKLDKTKPQVTGITGVIPGTVYTKANAPVAGELGCTASDSLSGVASCSATLVGAPVPLSTSPYDVPAARYTVRAVATDVAGNVSAEQTFTYVVQGIDLAGSGRMTGSATLRSLTYGTVTASFTLRCDGSPNQLTVKWKGNKSFTLDRIVTTGDPSSSTGYASWCWASGSNTKPHAPLDSLRMVGEGHLKDGTPATIDFSLLDRSDARGKILDLARFTVRTKTSDVLQMTTEGLITDGNVQAHAATGIGTNDNGRPNGWNGHTDHPASVASSASTRDSKYRQAKAKGSHR